MKDLRILGDGNHITTASVINQSDYINIAELIGGTRQNFNVSSEASIVLFSATSDFYCLIGSSVTASIPIGSILDGSASEFNPIARELLPGDKISLISVVNCKVTMAFYR